MTSRIARFAAEIFVVMVVSANSTLAIAQSTDVDAPADEIEVLQARIEENSADAKLVRELMKEADGDLRELLDRRLEARNFQIIEDVNALAKRIVDEENAGNDVGESRTVIIDYLQQLMPTFQTIINREYKGIITLISGEQPDEIRDAMAREVELNHDVSTLVGWYSDYYASIGSLDSFGIDAAKEQSYIAAQLQNFAELLVDIINLTTRRLKDTKSILALIPDDQDLQSRLNLIELRRDMALSNLSAVAALMEKLDVDSTDYNSLVLKVSGDISTGALETDVWAKLLGQWNDNAWNWLSENGLDWFLKILFLIVILYVARALSKIVRRLVEGAVSNVNLSNLLRRMIVSTAANGVLILGVLIALWQVGISVGPVLAGLGIAGIIIGFALQDTLSNFASGMMILLYRPYDVGDIIDAAGELGTVTDMSLVSTMILTFDNQKLVVPNKLIWGGVIRNVTAEKIRRVDMTFGISYDDDIPKAESILTDILSAHELVLDNPQPMVRVHALGESSVDFVARPWVKTEDYWEVYWGVTRDVKLRFDDEGITIPYPQRDVHVQGTASPERKIRENPGQRPNVEPSKSEIGL